MILFLSSFYWGFLTAYMKVWWYGGKSELFKERKYIIQTWKPIISQANGMNKHIASQDEASKHSTAQQHHVAMNKLITVMSNLIVGEEQQYTTFMKRSCVRPGHRSADGFRRETFITQIKDAFGCWSDSQYQQLTTSPCSHQLLIARPLIASVSPVSHQWPNRKWGDRHLCEQIDTHFNFMTSLMCSMTNIY